MGQVQFDFIFRHKWCVNQFLSLLKVNIDKNGRKDEDLSFSERGRNLNCT